MTKSSLPTQVAPLRLAVLLLAAGEGSRLGKHPKALIRKDGLTLLQRFSSVIQELVPTEYIVVTGYHSEVIGSEIERLNLSLTHLIKVIQNPAPERGHASSVRLGLESFKGVFDVLLVALSDQPEIGVREVQELMDTFLRRETGKEIILPIAEGKRGNPVLFSQKAISEILAIPGMVCREYMDAHPDQVRPMLTSNRAFVMDVDTLEDIQLHKLSLT
jgi:CTP:molybdopterin cytidylyltransferase MocA